MYKYVVQLVAAGLLFTVTTIVAWYEGSAIIEKSVQWAYLHRLLTFLI